MNKTLEVRKADWSRLVRHSSQSDGGRRNPPLGQPGTSSPFTEISARTALAEIGGQRLLFEIARARARPMQS
jgi:hypothetical protein